VSVALANIRTVVLTICLTCLGASCGGPGPRQFRRSISRPRFSKASNRFRIQIVSPGTGPGSCDGRSMP
jgi:hypothetical protein